MLINTLRLIQYNKIKEWGTVPLTKLKCESLNKFVMNSLRRFGRKLRSENVCKSALEKFNRQLMDLKKHNSDSIQTTSAFRIISMLKGIS